MDYAKLNRLATRLISKNGMTIVLRKRGGLTGPPMDEVEADPTFQPLHVVKFEHQQRDQSGALIGETVTTLYVTAEGPVPAKGDRVKLDDAASFLLDPDDAIFTHGYEIDEVRELSPAGIVVMFECDIRT